MFFWDSGGGLWKTILDLHVLEASTCSARSFWIGALGLASVFATPFFCCTLLEAEHRVHAGRH